jgi:aminoglycoside phosphotransferase (APT) family kinase protein
LTIHPNSKLSGTLGNINRIIVSKYQLHAIQILAEKLLEQPIRDVKKLGSGATSTAWSISCGSEQFIFRATHSTTNRPITYRSEFMILQALQNKGLPVPEALYNSYEQSFDFDESISAWAITRTIAGQAILQKKLSPQVATQLGKFLATLHDLPCSNFGRLDEESKTLKGQQISQVEGICARWCWAQLYPFDNSSLSDNPITIMASDLLSPLIAIEEKLWDISRESKAVITHSDLYGEHIFIANGELSGIIDFGASFIATAAWDFAVLAYYHGWKVLDFILNSYTSIMTQRRHLREQAHYLAIVVGLYKLEKAVRLKNDIKKQERIIQFISETMQLL